MAQADAFDSTFHHRNLAKILDRAMRLAEMAGQETDYIRREELLDEALLCRWAAQRLRRWPSPRSRA
jgi:hypothetical protein